MWLAEQSPRSCKFASQSARRGGPHPVAREGARLGAEPEALWVQAACSPSWWFSASSRCTRIRSRSPRRTASRLSTWASRAPTPSRCARPLRSGTGRTGRERKPQWHHGGRQGRELVPLPRFADRRDPRGEVLHRVASRPYAPAAALPSAATPAAKRFHRGRDREAPEVEGRRRPDLHGDRRSESSPLRQVGSAAPRSCSAENATMWESRSTKSPPRNPVGRCSGSHAV